ncbi:DUF3772 domain-containing protein [Paracoccus shanxieyensis]|uniref:DUF3772 domain-containing protein n=1 Tax=Paracoccus shanxieyensis TaxID=2675752 RepID=A0A6L6J0F5_9RHOB|nr:DUF3772 domain-containing protein [Paracoccus shanxieyensis]MTH64720.1 DUF3772 domain-containing protein [Paracoccus shanxieyensis]MTH87864.1 DUF3772 domain-containing protein [Paracoccus shanxieyensis]
MQRLIALFSALFVTLSLLLAAPVMAQDQQVPDFEAWEKLADQSEQILQSGQANDARLQSIREEVVEWRDRLGAARGLNGTRIGTLRDQINALGPPPAEGATEAEDLAARRKELNDQLSQLQAPATRAGESFGRADGIVQQIDQTLRQRQAFALVRQTPSPLNPTHWLPALQEAGDVGKHIYDEARGRWDNAGGMSGFTSRLPVVGGFLLVALILLSRGRHWIDSLPSRLSARATERWRGALVFGVSLGQIAIPLIGVILIAAALIATDLFADWGMPVLLSIPAAGLSFFGGIWLSRRMFPEPDSGVVPPLPVSESHRRPARFRTAMLAMILALHQLFARSILPLAGFNSQSDDGTVPQRLSEASAGVWHLILILLGALFLFQLCNILRKLRTSEVSDAPDYRVRVVAFLGIIGRVIALVAPLLAAAGYVTAGNAILWASIMTLALVGLVIVLQDFTADLWVMAKGGDQSARDGLLPVLVSFALVVLSLPLFALVWGASASDLLEAWTRTQQGFTVGGVRLSPMAVLMFIIVFIIGYSLTSFIQGAFRTSILPKTKLDSGGQTAVTSMIGYVGVALAALLAISAAGINLTSLAFVAGALSVGIGFGMQQVVSNFVSGIILLVERPIAVGDWIEVGGQQGIVKKMAVRATQIQTFDRTQVIVPNSNLITQPVTNWTRTSLQGRIIVPISVVNGSDHRLVTKILREIAEDQPTVMVTPPPSVFLRSVNASGQNYELRAIISDINGGVGVTSEINHQILERFAEAGIILPSSTRPSMDVFLQHDQPQIEPVEPADSATPPEDPRKLAQQEPAQNDGAEGSPSGSPEGRG